MAKAKAEKNPHANQWVSIHADPERPMPDKFELRKKGSVNEGQRLSFDKSDPEFPDCARLLFGDDAHSDGIALDATDLDWLSQACAIMAAELERRGYTR